jgi:hypothetical protein
MASPTEDLAARVKTSADFKVGRKAVKGSKAKGGIDCFALIDEVLRSADAKSASDFGSVTPDADYVWGDAVALDALRPGDVLQFRNHTLRSVTQTLGDRGWQVTSEEGPAVRPHHSAIVLEILADGSIVVAEQNVRPHPDKVTRNVIAALAEGEVTRYRGNSEKVTITVTGTVKAYRPVPKSKGASLFRLNQDAARHGRGMLARNVRSEGGPTRTPGPLGRG